MKKKILFLKLFSKNLILGLSILLVLLGSISANKNLLKQGPDGVLADDGNSEYAGSQDWESPTLADSPDYGSSEAVYSAPMDYTQDYGNSEYVTSEPLYDYGNSEFVSSEPFNQPQPAPVQIPKVIDYPLRPQSTGVISTGPTSTIPAQQQTVYPLRPQSAGVMSTGPVSQMQPPPIYQIRSTPQSTGPVSGPLTYTYNYDYDSHNSVDSHNRSTSTVDSHNRTNIDDNSISGSYNDSHNISGSYNDQRRNDQSQAITVPASQGGPAIGQSMGSNYLTTAPNTGLSYPYPYSNPAYLAPMTQQVVTYPIRPVVQTQYPPSVTYGASNSYPIYTTQAAPAVVVQDPNVTKAVVYDTQPKVITAGVTDATNLPKTGLPIAGLGLGALLPIGLKLRKMGKFAYTEHTLSPNSLWQERQSQLLTA